MSTAADFAAFLAKIGSLAYFTISNFNIFLIFYKFQIDIFIFFIQKPFIFYILVQYILYSLLLFYKNT